MFRASRKKRSTFEHVEAAFCFDQTDIERTYNHNQQTLKITAKSQGLITRAFSHESHTAHACVQLDTVKSTAGVHILVMFVDGRQPQIDTLIGAAAAAHRVPDGCATRRQHRLKQPFHCPKRTKRAVVLPDAGVFRAFQPRVVAVAAALLAFRARHRNLDLNAHLWAIFGNGHGSA